jgi:ABC-2 type transport system permease protein
MTLVTAERIKLFSTRSPYWCLIAIAVAALAFAAITGNAGDGMGASSYSVLRGANLGMSIFMVLAALSITTEYRFGTIKSTFLAAPRRPAVLLAKTALVAVLGLLVGVVVALASFYLAKALAASPPEPLQLSTTDDLRQVLGYGPLFAIAGVIAVAVGSMIRQSAGAVTILLLWPLLIERLLSLIPGAEDFGPWLPFTAADRWVAPATGFFAGEGSGPTPIQGLLAFAAWALLLWLIAMVLLQRRDA